MLLTKRYLRKILEGMRASISESREKELLSLYGQTCIDTEGYERDFTEQDIYENVRKVVREEECHKKNIIPHFLLPLSFNDK